MTILLPLAGRGLIVLGADWFGDGAYVITPHPCAVYYYYLFINFNIQNHVEINFKKVRTGKDLAISSITLLAGVGLFFVNKGVGIIIAVCGLLMLLVYKTGYKKDGQGVVLTKKSEDLCKACKPSIVDFLNGKDTTPSIKKGSEGGCVRLDVYFNQTEGIAFAQLHDFNNYAYEPATEVVELKGDKVNKLISQL